MRVTKLGISALLPAFVLTAAPPPDAARVLTQMADAYSKNSSRTADYVYRELIRTTDIDRKGKKNLTEREYEISFIEGARYYRLVAVNGKPLPERVQKQEDERIRSLQLRRSAPANAAWFAENDRLHLDLGLLAQTHQARYAGTATVDGRPVWVLEVEGINQRLKPNSPARYAVLLDGRLMIDQETHFPLRAEMIQRKDWHGKPAGTLLRYEWRRVEDTWLLGKIETWSKWKLLDTPSRETRQVQEYSDYQRFRADSKLVLPVRP